MGSWCHYRLVLWTWWGSITFGSISRLLYTLIWTLISCEIQSWFAWKLDQFWTLTLAILHWLEILRWHYYGEIINDLLHLFDGIYGWWFGTIHWCYGWNFSTMIFLIPLSLWFMVMIDDSNLVVFALLWMNCGTPSKSTPAWMTSISVLCSSYISFTLISELAR